MSVFTGTLSRSLTSSRHTSSGIKSRASFTFRGSDVRVFSTVNAINCADALYTLDGVTKAVKQCDRKMPVAYTVATFKAADLDPLVPHTLVIRADNTSALSARPSTSPPT